jgi:putative transposase
LFGASVQSPGLTGSGTGTYGIGSVTSRRMLGKIINKYLIFIPMNLESDLRKSAMTYGELYFYTATINSWKPLLQNDQFKEIIIESLSYLSAQGKIEVFAFVLMPNHVHFIWKPLELNGKESPQASFFKYTAHQFKKALKVQNPTLLEEFRVSAENKEYEFWQRDPKAYLLYTPELIFQKLEYIHNNPMQAHWNLANAPEEYYYSSASFYLTDRMPFLFLKDIRELI